MTDCLLIDKSKYKAFNNIYFQSIPITFHGIIDSGKNDNNFDMKNKGPITIRRTHLPTFLVNLSTFAFLLNFSSMK